MVLHSQNINSILSLAVSLYSLVWYCIVRTLSQFCVWLSVCTVQYGTAQSEHYLNSVFGCQFVQFSMVLHSQNIIPILSLAVSLYSLVWYCIVRTLSQFCLWLSVCTVQYGTAQSGHYLNSVFGCQFVQFSMVLHSQNIIPILSLAVSLYSLVWYCIVRTLSQFCVWLSVCTVQYGTAQSEHYPNSVFGCQFVQFSMVLHSQNIISILCLAVSLYSLVWYYIVRTLSQFCVWLSVCTVQYGTAQSEHYLNSVFGCQFVQFSMVLHSQNIIPILCLAVSLYSLVWYCIVRTLSQFCVWLSVCTVQYGITQSEHYLNSVFGCQFVQFSMVLHSQNIISILSLAVSLYSLVWYSIVRTLSQFCVWLSVCTVQYGTAQSEHYLNSVFGCQFVQFSMVLHSQNIISILSLAVSLYAVQYGTPQSEHYPNSVFGCQFVQFSMVLHSQNIIPILCLAVSLYSLVWYCIVRTLSQFCVWLSVCTVQYGTAQSEHYLNSVFGCQFVQFSMVLHSQNIIPILCLAVSLYSLVWYCIVRTLSQFCVWLSVCTVQYGTAQSEHYLNSVFGCQFVQFSMVLHSQNIISILCLAVSLYSLVWYCIVRTLSQFCLWLSVCTVQYGTAQSEHYPNSVWLSVCTVQYGTAQSGHYLNSVFGCQFVQFVLHSQNIISILSLAVSLYSLVRYCIVRTLSQFCVWLSVCTVQQGTPQSEHYLNSVFGCQFVQFSTVLHSQNIIPILFGCQFVQFSMVLHSQDIIPILFGCQFVQFSTVLHSQDIIPILSLAVSLYSLVLCHRLGNTDLFILHFSFFTS